MCALALLCVGQLLLPSSPVRVCGGRHQLAVQRVVGTFAGSTAVKGNTSGAQWTSVAAAAATAPTLHDPLSDNAFLQGNPLSVVKSRGTHMLED